MFVSNNGYEYALILLAATISLAFRGAGSVSIDRQLSKRVTTS